MSDKNTPSGRALEDFKALPCEQNCTATLRDLGAWVLDNHEAVVIALLRSHAIESDSLIAKDIPASDDLERGYDRCLERLKGIGHDENR